MSGPSVMFDGKEYQPSGLICKFLADVAKCAEIRTPEAITILDLMRAGFVFLICLTLPAVCSAQVVQLHTSTGKGSAVCVGTTEADGQLFVTVRHNFEDGSDGRIQFKGRWYALENLELSDTEDLACFTSHARTKPLPIFEGSLTHGAEVDVPGFGPFFNGRNDSLLVRHGRVEDLELVVNSDSQVVPGDSGCPVVYQDRTVGIVRAFFNDSPRETQIIPAVKVHKFLTRCQWHCTPNGCYIRQRVRQPIAGLVIPIGPPQIETQIIPAPPQTRPAPRPIPDENFESPKVVQGPRGERGPAGEKGERGERGAQGPAGKDGSDGVDGRGPDPKQVEDIVVAWLEANRDQLRGRDGEPGERGLIGVPSEPELQAVIDTWVARNDDRIRGLIVEIVREQLKSEGKAFDSTAIEKRITAIEKRPLKVVIAADGKIKDQADYLPGEPVVFDLRRIKEMIDDK